MAEPALELAGLHVVLGGSHVLQGVSFEVPRGGVTALLGRNGVGKTTTLRAVLGLVPSTGSITLLGQSVSGWPTYRIVRCGVGYVPEDRDVFTRLSVEENLRLAETSRPGDYDGVFALFPELKRRARQRAGTLSGGQQQMLAIARVLLYERQLLVVDEPTKGLAPKLVSEVVDVLERAARSSTVLLVEQNVHAVRRLAERFVVLDHGAVVHTGEAGSLEDESLVRRLLGVSVSVR
ncbi:MAG TPA: ABC transporter ATP-binding protein [Acidimicrobiales bacterium]|nr:ABC transporter ATP-binding protein [Acidimicrobiales bacterium]